METNENKKVLFEVLKDSPYSETEKQEITLWLDGILIDDKKTKLNCESNEVFN